MFSFSCKIHIVYYVCLINSKHNGHFSKSCIKTFHFCVKLCSYNFITPMCVCQLYLHSVALQRWIDVHPQQIYTLALENLLQCSGSWKLFSCLALIVPRRFSLMLLCQALTWLWHWLFVSRFSRILICEYLCREWKEREKIFCKISSQQQECLKFAYSVDCVSILLGLSIEAVFEINRSFPQQK